MHRSTLNAHWARRKAILYFTSFTPGLAQLAAAVECLVTDVRYTVIIRFHIIAQRSKGAHYYLRVIGLVVYLYQWFLCTHM